MFLECKNYIGRLVVDDALFESYKGNNRITQYTFQLLRFMVG